MRINFFKANVKTAVRAAAVLLLGVGTAIAQQQQINLTAGPSNLTMPDGTVVPMWGYTCGAAVAGSTAICAKSIPAAAGWSPVVITAVTGSTLQINLTNSLTFSNGNTVPTSLTIVGQVGGGLGTTATSTASPDHSNAQGAVTWSIVGDSSSGTTPPTQGKRVQSFSTEVAAGATTSLTWSSLQPGTYLIESGTHPSIQGPMGLYGILVVTTAPSGATAGTAYPGVSYNAEVPLLFSEIDPVQNNAVSAAVNKTGFSETAVWSGLTGGCGNPASANYQTCYPPAVNYTPLYYLINGAAFDKTNASTSLFPASLGTATPPVAGTVLVRMVNAGLRMHVPSIVGAQTSYLGTAKTPPPVSSGFTLIAEDGNLLPGAPRVQSEVFMAAGKTYDVSINVPAAGGTALPIYDRELSLSGNKIGRDAGMLAYVSVNGAALPTAPALGAAVANPDSYASVTPGQTLTIADPSMGVIANDLNVYGVKVLTAPTLGTLNLNPDGTFSYSAASGWTGPDSFVYQANGSGPTATVTLSAAPIEAASGITVNNISYTSNLATSLKISTPGVLSVDTDAAGYPLTVNAASVVPATGLTVTVNSDGSFNASVATPGTYTFAYKAQNSQGTVSTSSATVTLIFPKGSGLLVKVLDGNDKTTQITDYRWIIEEDRTFYTDPACAQSQGQLQANRPPQCQSTPVNFGTNFHTSYMPVVATGCTGTNSCASGQTVLGAATACDIGNGICETPATLPSGSSVATQRTPVDPSQVHLDPSKRYYISVLPGDAAQPFIAGYAGSPDCAGTKGGVCGHGMGGAPVPAACNIPFGSAVCTGTPAFAPVTVLTEPSPYPPATLSVFVFEDDHPLNGEHDAGGGIDTLSPDEPGLGGFQITIADNAGGTGDSTGTPTYDMFNMPLSNALAGTIDPVTKADACPISTQVTANAKLPGLNATPAQCKADPSLKGCQGGIVGMIMTCPKYESDGLTLSPLAGQAVVKNLWPGRYGVIANPGADRIGRGEEWVQTNTLDGQKAHDSFMRIGEPGYFQEFGPAGYHVSIGFANPKIITDRGAALCPPNTTPDPCPGEVTGHVTTARMSRTPDERLYGSGDHSAYSFTQCYVSLGDPDGAEFGFSKCDEKGNFDFKKVPPGNWKITTFDQWNDQVVDGITTAVALCDPAKTPGCKTTVDMGEVGVHQWQANIYTRSFIDMQGTGVSDDTKPGLPLAATNIRFRDGSYSNFNNTDLDGYAGFNEVFPLFNWYVIESDNTRYKNTGTHVVYDAGGPADKTSPNTHSCNTGTTPGAPTKPCGNSTIAANLANTFEPNPLPAALSVPGAVYCTDADCGGFSIADGPAPSSETNYSTGRIDPPWVDSYGWQGFSGQASFLEFGKKPFADGENGGIMGHVVYASTRPFDDPQLLLQLSWEPLIPHVTINLYKEGLAQDGVTQTLALVDHTETSSFDDWAQGFRSDGIPNMNCPGQGADALTSPLASDPYFFFTLHDQPQWLDLYNHPGVAPRTLPNHSQFKCYDGMHNWNQLQPAPYDGFYRFPSVTARNPNTGNMVPGGTNCTICGMNPDATDKFRYNKEPMLPHGKYVVEVVVPPGYELVKEEDKNILIGDNFIAPVSQQFGGLGSIYILPDQAEISSQYNGYNAQNSTNNLGRISNLPSHEADTGSDESFWPCVGALRTVPDFISLFPGSSEVAPFAGATRPLCDRKEVSLDDQTAVLTKFYLFTETHAASHFTGQITDDFAAEFDPFSPAFGEKFAPAYLPVGIKDWAGNEINRVYADQWGVYNGLNYSTWEVNPPNPTGYGPTMMVNCMNDAGPIPDPKNPGQTIPDPLYQSGYSQFCYELPYMPGQTGYFDTPVVPTSAFAGDYNTPDCAYPDTTPAVSEVDGDGIGPWVSAAGHTLTINALGNQNVDNYAYSGPSATVAPFNQQRVARHYGFGGTQGKVTIGSDASGTPISATVTSWSDTQIKVTVPTGVQPCAVQQQVQYGGSTAQCGQLIITTAPTTANPKGLQSVDTVAVTVGGKAPTHVAATASVQGAIDAAKPGDLIIIDPTCSVTATSGPVACATAGATTHTAAAHTEMLLMWKPVRLQGVGAVSSVIDANPHPAGRLDPWRRQVVCLFGLALNGTPITATNPYDPNYNGTAGSGFTCSAAMQFQVDRLPLEATVGWDASLNGNLAEQLIEPTIMGAYEGAGITVLSKGVYFPTGTSPFASDVFPAGTLLLNGTANATNGCGANTATAHNPFPSNFLCNPSSIDGLTVKNSSQGGGGILVHGWGHNLQIANNRVLNNQGTLSGGITIGQGEHPDVYQIGNVANSIPGSCISPNAPANLALPYCFDRDVNVHNNQVVQNSSLGDELFSSTPAGAGGVTFCNGSDYYKFNYNWVCGNMSTGDGAGVAHIGFSYDGDIEHNSILFNQSTNPTITTNGGGLLIMGAPDQDPPCGITTDVDCLSDPSLISPSDGTGPGLVINANLILGNSADAGSGGGLRLQHINGTDVLNFHTGNATTSWPVITGNGHPSTQPTFQTRTPWNAIQVTNNIIANNVAGWDGGGVSLQDALATDLVNNTIVSNNSTASSGVLFQSLFAPLASTPGTNCISTSGSGSCAQVAGLVSVGNSAVLSANMVLPAGGGIASFTCPAGHGTNTSVSDCTKYSIPILYNDLFWQNRSTIIGVGPLAGGLTNQNSLVTPYNAPFGATAAVSQQASSGACDTTSTYWDIGARGDTTPGASAVHPPGGTLTPIYSLLTNTGTLQEGTAASDIAGGTKPVSSVYCNGSRVPPEIVNTGLQFPGWQVPPGTNESNALPAPPFQLQPAATVDEGNNWINLRWGPLSVNMTVPDATSTTGFKVPFTFDPSLILGPAVNHIPSSAGGTLGAYTLAPSLDFYNQPRKTNNAVDIGAVEFVAAAPLAPTLTSIAPNSGTRGAVVPVTLTGANLTGTTAITVSGTGVTVSAIAVVSATSVTATFTITGTATLGARNVTVTTAGGTSNAVTFTVTAPPAPTLTSISPATGARGTLVLPVTLTGTNLTGASAITVSGTGVTVSGLTVVNATTVTANFTISATATQSARTVSVTTPGGTSNTVTFTVVAASGSLTFTSATNGTLGTILGVRTLTFTIPAPRAPVTSAITITNAGPGTLQITEEVLTINLGSLYSVTGTTCSFTTPLAVGGTCTVSVRYATPTTQPALPDLGALGVINNGTTPNGALVLSAR